MPEGVRRHRSLPGARAAEPTGPGEGFSSLPASESLFLEAQPLGTLLIHGVSTLHPQPRPALGEGVVVEP